MPEKIQDGDVMQSEPKPALHAFGTAGGSIAQDVMDKS